MPDSNPAESAPAPFVIIPAGLHMVDFGLPRLGADGTAVWDAPGLGAVLETVYGHITVAMPVESWRALRAGLGPFLGRYDAAHPRLVTAGPGDVPRAR